MVGEREYLRLEYYHGTAGLGFWLRGKKYGWWKWGGKWMGIRVSLVDCGGTV
ncbi:hypothetical protein [Leptospira langatensis]|uniref:hypothetical protein n=1 Tax=Leptospira langatensis TaxID=2484983 RepID=UPI0014386AB9|nr:hypothetical protein [Leptospira langatensis]